MARSKKFLLLAISPLGLSLGACSPEMSEDVSYRAGETTEATSLYDGVGDVPTAAPADKSTTTLITNNEISPIQPINPGKFAICGDGTLTTFTGEECDDGNTINGDGCSKQCKIEKNSGPTKFPGGVLQPIKPIKPIKPGAGIPPKFPGTNPGKLPIPWPPGGGSTPGGGMPTGVACLPGDEPPTTQSNTLCTEDENTFAGIDFIGVLDSTLGYNDCEQFEIANSMNGLLPGFTVSSLFPQAVNGVDRAPGLAGYCRIAPAASTFACEDPLADLAQYFFDAAADLPVVGPQLPDGILEDIRIPSRDAFHAGAGVTDVDAALSVTSPVRIDVLDTAPENWSGLVNSAANLNSGHGPGVETIIRRIACGDPAQPQGACNRQVKNRLALPRVRNTNGPAFLAVTDNVRGGHMGTIGDVATSIDDSLRTQRGDNVFNVGDKQGPEYLVMNMSLGWEGAAWGDLDPADKSNKTAVLDVATNTTADQGVPASVRAALAATMVASCEGAMMFAAVGNANNFTCDGGPLAPAAWESIGRPDHAGCVAKSLFVGSGASKNDTVANWSGNFGQSSATSLEPVYEPLVFGVSATNYDAEELSMQRNDATARLAALGFRSVDEDLNGDWTQIQSGTSIATAVVSASMANAWSGLAVNKPMLSPASIVELVYNASPKMEEDQTYDSSGIPTNACDALSYLASSPPPYSPTNVSVEANFELGYPEGGAPSPAVSHVINSCAAVAAVTGVYPLGCTGEVTLADRCDVEDGFDLAESLVAASTDPAVGIDDVDEAAVLPGLVPPMLPGSVFGGGGGGGGGGGASYADGCSELLPSASGASCLLSYDFVDGTGTDPGTNGGDLPTNYALPQPKTNGCPACEIVEGGPEIVLNTSSAIAPLGPHHVVVTRKGRGRNPPCSPLVIDLGELSLSDARLLVISSAAFGVDACRPKAEVDITYQDASGAEVTVTESIPVR